MLRLYHSSRWPDLSNTEDVIMASIVSMLSLIEQQRGAFISFYNRKMRILSTNLTQERKKSNNVLFTGTIILAEKNVTR